MGMFLISQWVLFFQLLKYKNLDVVFYINTVLPFGGALAGFMMRKKIVYHIHETSVSPRILKFFLFGIVEKTAYKKIYVSEFLKNSESNHDNRSAVVYNALPDLFLYRAASHQTRLNGTFRVLMICSLKKYKGVLEYAELAGMLPGIQFELVLNAIQSEIDAFFADIPVPENLRIYPVQQDVHPFYQQANLVLNLSRKDEWIETFGLTVLEAFNYGIPVIVPTVGGIAEIVSEGLDGFKIDSENVDIIAQKIRFIASDPNRYKLLSMNARKKASIFHSSKMNQSIHQLIFNP
jgi:glycosyltransferase involved in cell wall biosynthesis